MENNEQTINDTLNNETQETKVNKQKTAKRNIRKKTEAKDTGEKDKKTVARKPRAPRNKKTPIVTNAEETLNHAEETVNHAEEPTSNTDSTQETPTEVNETSSQEPQVIPNPSIPSLPNITINNIVDLLQAPMRSIVLTDQQIQQLTLEEIRHRHRFLEETLARVLDYDVVISDTNIWLELLIGYTSSHSDPRYNARLQFERQLEFISKLTHYRGGRFIILGETYEEIDRFATMLDPTDHRDADFTDNIVCLNTAARLAKRLILAQQRENRLRICGIGAESHHAAFADPAIIRKVAELFAAGKKVLLMTNDASVAIRAMGICDDLQRYNDISDEDWDKLYAPLRPMVFTFDDLKQLDFYTRQYHYIQMAAGTPWMADIDRAIIRNRPAPLCLSADAFRPGDKHRSDNLFSEQEVQQAQQKVQQASQLKKQQTKPQNNKPAAKQPDNTPQRQQKSEQQTNQQATSPQPLPTPTADPHTPKEPVNTTTNEQKPKPHSRRKPQRRKAAADKGGE